MTGREKTILALEEQDMPAWKLINQKRAVAAMAEVQAEIDQMVEPVIAALREQKMLTWELMNQRAALDKTVCHYWYGRRMDAIALTSLRLQQILEFSRTAKTRELTEEDFEFFRKKMQEYRERFDRHLLERGEVASANEMTQPANTEIMTARSEASADVKTEEMRMSLEKVDSLTEVAVETIINRQLELNGATLRPDEMASLSKQCRIYYPALAATASEWDFVKYYLYAVSPEAQTETEVAEYMRYIQTLQAELEALQNIPKTNAVMTEMITLQRQMDAMCRTLSECSVTDELANDLTAEVKRIAVKVDSYPADHPLVKVTHERAAHLMFYVTMMRVENYTPDMRWTQEKKAEFDELVERYR